MSPKATGFDDPEGLGKSTQGSKLASKGAYIDVSDRRMQVQLTPEAKIASDFYFIRAIFAFVGFVSALSARPLLVGRALVYTAPTALAGDTVA